MVIGDPGAPRLVVTEPAGQAGLVLSLSAPEMVIGHSETADLILEDRFVSRRHALVTVEGSGTVTIRDLNSTGGTFVNGERLAGPPAAVLPLDRALAEIRAAPGAAARGAGRGWSSGLTKGPPIRHAAGRIKKAMVLGGCEKS